MTPTTIHFVRHGTVYNPKNIFYGRLPRFGLSAEGLQLAVASGVKFAGKPIAKIFSSPMLRARQTSKEIAKAIGDVTVSVSSDLNEVRSPYDGFPIEEMEARHWDIYSGTTAPFEQPIQVLERTYRFIRKVMRTYSGKQIIAVTHADVILFLSLHTRGYEVNYRNKSLVEQKKIAIPFPAPASVTTFTWRNGQELPEVEF